MNKIIFILTFLTALSVNFVAAAQGVREPAKATAQTTSAATGSEAATVNSQTNLPKSSPAPNTVAAQYQGGLFGYQKKLKGTLNFDDVSKRLVFRNAENKEIFGMPYKSLLVIYGDSKSYRPTGATVASSIPVPYGLNLPFAFIRGKKRFLIVQFDDPDSKIQGTTSFRIANKELLQSVVQSLGEKAELKQRGDAFYRPREISKPVL